MSSTHPVDAVVEQADVLKQQGNELFKRARLPPCAVFLTC